MLSASIIPFDRDAPQLTTKQFLHRLPDVCKHALVPEGQVCPECIWEYAAFRTPPGRQGDLLRAGLMCEMIEVCASLVPPDLRQEVYAEAERGNWYALSFVRRWKDGQH